ncbi:Uncharacterised protein [Mycobacteroides abscessus subsp. abscessus]|nr:Uncharacterised protein [Mycobacteroides abscessus]SIF71601.1 Uncharacterised protein [Mycobacteroides abscessus subsp. abscessus]CPZ46599.1 Uncharacterised protein [Mycobacteroides abscessus]SIM61050.1 Uncharacterised protein [Mycobacteroides abscessus subsp. abscessus]SKQ34867.1 Uncharacterised protein [Mycobacteroides abscessus subsp. abscessus]
MNACWRSCWWTSRIRSRNRLRVITAQARCTAGRSGRGPTPTPQRLTSTLKSLGQYGIGGPGGHVGTKILRSPSHLPTPRLRTGRCSWRPIRWAVCAALRPPGIAHRRCGHGPKTQGPYLARRSREPAENIASDLVFATFWEYWAPLPSGRRCRIGACPALIASECGARVASPGNTR